MNQQGFSLVELLISFLIISSLILGTAELTLHSLHVKKRSDVSVKSAELASSKLEYFKSLLYESDELADGSWSEDFIDDFTHQSFHREWSIQAVSFNMKKIEITCYSENYREKKMRLVLYLCKELGF